MIGYEEITLPTMCTHWGETQSSCTLGTFDAKTSVSAREVKFRPDYPCSRYLRARRDQTEELWHPVKARACLGEWLSSHAYTGPPPRREPQLPAPEPEPKQGPKHEHDSVKPIEPAQTNKSSSSAAVKPPGPQFKKRAEPHQRRHGL